MGRKSQESMTKSTKFVISAKAISKPNSQQSLFSNKKSLHSRVSTGKSLSKLQQDEPQYEIPFKISEWSSQHGLDDQQNTPKKSLSSYSCKHGKTSVLHGTSRMNRPTRTIIDYFISEIENPKGKISRTETSLITKLRKYTYQDIHEISNQVADILKATLRESYKPSPDGYVIIGIAFPNKEQEIITKLGILKAGCTYFPIDHINSPPSHIFDVVDAIGPTLIITSDEPKFLEKFRLVVKSNICGLMAINSLWKIFDIKPEVPEPDDNVDHTEPNSNDPTNSTSAEEPELTKKNPSPSSQKFSSSQPEFGK